MPKTMLNFLLLAATAGLCARGAESLETLQQRMRGRLPELSVLKQQKVVGETWDGFAAVVPGAAATAAATRLVQAENADRRDLYRRIAEKLETSADTVGQKRAEEIRSKAKRGLMLQAADGSWHEQK